MMRSLSLALLNMALSGVFLSSTSALAQSSTPVGEMVPVSAEVRHWRTLMHERAQRFIVWGKDWPAGQHRVTARVTVDAQGTITDQALYVSSGHPIVDEAVMTALRRMGRLPDPPPAMSTADRQFDLPFLLHADRGSFRHHSTPNARFEDRDRQVAFEVPAPLALQTPRARPGHAWVVGLGARTGHVPSVAGQTRVCDVGLQPQRAAWQMLGQDQLNAERHHRVLDAELRDGAGTGNPATPSALLRFGSDVMGRETVVTPSGKPAERHYLAVADTPQYRLTITCATTDTHIDSAVPVFRAIAASVQLPQVKPAPTSSTQTLP